MLTNAHKELIRLLARQEARDQVEAEIAEGPSGVVAMLDSPIEEVDSNAKRSNTTQPERDCDWLVPLQPEEDEDFVEWLDRFSLAQLKALSTCEPLRRRYGLTTHQLMHGKISEIIRLRPAAKRDALLEASRMVRVDSIPYRQLTSEWPDDFSIDSERTAARLFAKANATSNPGLVELMLEYGRRTRLRLRGFLPAGETDGKYLVTR